MAWVFLASKGKDDEIERKKKKNEKETPSDNQIKPRINNIYKKKTPYKGK